MEGEKKKKIYSKEAAYEKACTYCAYQERAQQEVRDKLYDLGLHQEEVEELISKLIQENFINEERFAQTYARGRFKLKGWGRYKIRQGLQGKRVSPRCIDKGLAEIDDEEYLATLIKLAEKKKSATKAANPLQHRQKVAIYLIGRGFEPELVYDQLSELF